MITRVLLHQDVGLEAFNGLPTRRAVHALYECVNSVAMAVDLAKTRPYGDHAALYRAADAVLFALSIVGIFMNRRNLIVLLMAIELMLLAVNLNFVAFSYFLGDLHGQVFVFFILTVAAAESAIGLAILVLLFRNKTSIHVEELDNLKG
jgi:NADH-quinone oxidoreductase subunit K